MCTDIIVIVTYIMMMGMMMGWGVGWGDSSLFLTTKLEFTSSPSLVGRKGRGAVVSNGGQNFISARLRTIGSVVLATVFSSIYAEFNHGLRTPAWSKYKWSSSLQGIAL